MSIYVSTGKYIDIDGIIKKSNLKVVDSERYHMGTTYMYVLSPNKTV